ncbi:Uncharacterized protein DBV15_07831 [Temnothorax longispinosus]|uniref:Uncharacterized protein n=1 Tax=Temnothorax longispinosus TaxID=300112 RepID=A0A4S2K679_9HYME|nr:Uncharacterized protein DBV15_07831 [Temnothorax longispinosus]
MTDLGAYEQRYAREIIPNIAITIEAYLRADDYDRSHHTARGYMSGVDCSTRRRSYTPHRSSRAIRGMRRRHAEVVPNEQSETVRKTKVRWVGLNCIESVRPYPWPAIKPSRLKNEFPLERIFLGLACISVVVHLNLVVVCRTERNRYRLRYVLAARIAVVCSSILSGILTAHQIAYLYRDVMVPF